MNFGPPGPRISLRLWFSITMVNTVPPHPTGATADRGASARHDAIVVPEVLGAQAASDATSARDQEAFIRPEKLGPHSVLCNHNRPCLFVERAVLTKFPQERSQRRNSAITAG